MTHKHDDLEKIHDPEQYTYVFSNTSHGLRVAFSKNQLGKALDDQEEFERKQPDVKQTKPDIALLTTPKGQGGITQICMGFSREDKDPNYLLLTQNSLVEKASLGQLFDANGHMISADQLQEIRDKEIEKNTAAINRKQNKPHA